MEIKNIKEFKEIIAQDITVLDFFAVWCRPCVNFGPIFEELGQEMEDKAKFIKINIDNFPEIASDYGIISIPTVLILKNGVEVERIVGSVEKIKLKNLINQI